MAKWQLYKDRAGEFRARLVATNGQTVVWTEGYTSKQSAQEAIDWTKVNAPAAPVEDLT